jgi:hypothetical protein
MNDCGTCTLCCKLMGVVELDKPACAWCRHVDRSRGCTIYESRPPSCADYECVWLVSQRLPAPLPPELRPDRSRVMLNMSLDGSAVVAHVDPARPHAHTVGAAGRTLAKMRAGGQRVVIVIGERTEEAA